MANSYQNGQEKVIQADLQLIQCSFCQFDCTDVDVLREHSSRCLTDIDDLLLVTYKPDGEPRSKNATRKKTIYPNHSSIPEAVSSIRKEIEKREFNCDQCDWSGQNVTVYNDHFKTKHLGLMYPCEWCPHVSLTRRNLRLHIEALHTDGKYTVTCDECDQTFTHKEYLRKHKLCVHTDKAKKTWSSCIHCGIAVSNKKMKRHISRVHTTGKDEGEFKIPCIHCGEEIRRREMKQHLDNIHGTEPNLTGPKNSITLKDVEDKLQCTKCNCQFVNKIHLQTHMSQIHSRKHYMDCEKCGKSISFQNMPRHMKEMHFVDGEVFTCDNCKMVFSTLRQIKQHCKDVCSEGTSISYELLQDNNTKCELCDKTYSSKSSLRQHVERVHDNVINFKCKNCQQGFYMQNDYRRHIQKHISCQVNEAEDEADRIELMNSSKEAVTEPSIFSDPSHCAVQPMLPQHSSFITPDPVSHFQCEKCPKSFLAEEQLSLHVMHHDAMPKLAVVGKRGRKTLAKVASQNPPVDSKTPPIDPNIVKRPRGRPPKPKIQLLLKPRGRPPIDPEKKVEWMRKWQENLTENKSSHIIKTTPTDILVDHVEPLKTEPEEITIHENNLPKI